MRGVGIDDWEMGTRALDCGTELTWRLSVVRDSSRRYKEGKEEVGEEERKEKEGERREGSRNEYQQTFGFKVQSSKFRASMTHCSVNNVVFRTWGTFR